MLSENVFGFTKYLREFVALAAPRLSVRLYVYAKLVCVHRDSSNTPPDTNFTIYTPTLLTSNATLINNLSQIS